MAVMLPKTIPFALTTSLVDTATNTTIGTATLLTFTAPIPITIEETGSRSFLSVILHVGIRDRNTTGAATDLTGTRLGVQLGAAAVDNLDRTITQTGSTTNHWWVEWTRDCTAYFNAQFGAGTTQSVTATLAVSQAVASLIGGNVTAWFEITYAFDDTVGTRRMNAIPIGIGSHAGNYTLVAAEVGSDGTNGPGTSQIPILTGGSGLIKEASPTIVQAYIFADGVDGNNVAGTDLVPEWTIDATVFTRNVLGENTAGNICWYRDIIPYDTATFSTTATHAVKLRDTTVTGRYPNMGATLWVVYSYDKSTTTRKLVAARVGVQQSGSSSFEVPWVGGFNNGVAADALTYYFDLNIQEPGTITLERAHVVIDLINITAGSNNQFSAGAQAFRAYTTSSGGGTTDNPTIIHRCDYGSGWSLARGDNHLLFRQINGAGGNRGTLGHAYAWILYSCDVPAGGTEVCTKSLAFHGTSYQNAATVVLSTDISAASQIAPSFQNTVWSLVSMAAEGMVQANAAINWQLTLYALGGELDGAGTVTMHLGRKLGSTLQSRRWHTTLTQLMTPHWLAQFKLNPQTAHRAMISMTTAGIASMILRPTIHNISFTVAGTVTVNGAPAANGGFVDIYALNTTTLAMEYITEVLIAGGAGAFTSQVPDNTRGYICVYNDGSNTYMGSTSSFGGTPGGTFNISVRTTGTSDVAPPTETPISPTSNVQPGTGGGFSSDYQIAKGVPIVVQAVDALSAIAYVAIFIKYSNKTSTDVIYAGSGAQSGWMVPFKSFTSISGNGSPTVGYTFTILPDTLWPAVTPNGAPLAATITLQAVDASGNVLL